MSPRLASPVLQLLVLAFYNLCGVGVHLCVAARPPAHPPTVLQGLQFVFTKKGGVGIGVTRAQGFTIAKLHNNDDGTAQWSAPCFLSSTSLSLGAIVGESRPAVPGAAPLSRACWLAVAPGNMCYRGRGCAAARAGSTHLALSSKARLASPCATQESTQGMQ